MMNDLISRASTGGRTASGAAESEGEGMNEREKVIKGLEFCLYSEITYSGDCEAIGDCPYYDQTDGCMSTLMAEALALLKAQEPRVMTLEEVRDEAEYMYLEKHSKTGSDLYGCAIRGDCDGYGIELLMSEYDCVRGRWKDYGKTWRCWTSPPTDAQREAEPWEGGTNERERADL